ncbi:hypothetical protein KFZ70_11330 [Tamlana fucoidanivorans]|uniref:Uncharacterized protein n=1 Tax=Allotamlana fucoidanivorans TaxID=2583814 RepID=A0A5C4SJJ4_9FLAO|nr:c-type cytochrome domain-containing protein [Tamlana fucoidanivorans]TNJ43136.1 hypothetical protein FGF67_12310 [Tamlana fucoidanivorans]
MTEVPDFVLFLGRFHPLVVHLPIGFLFFAFLLEWFGKHPDRKALKSAVPFALFLGFITALIACVLGYMLSLSGDYEVSMLDSHFYFGVVTTVIVLLAWLIRVDKLKLTVLNTAKSNISLLTLIVVLLSITGHYGGNLTHGSDYLTKYLPFTQKEQKTLPKIAKVEDAVIFDYLAQPIIEEKCISCHNSNKKKGGLSFQDSLSIFKGGKNGKVVVAGNAMESEMIKRVLLDPKHDDFMPPEGKTPLTEDEIFILKYWIDNAHANFSSKVSAVKTSDSMKHIASVFLGFEKMGHNKEVTLPKVSPVETHVLEELMAEGFNFRELVFNSNVYEVVLPNYNMDKGTKDLTLKLQKLANLKSNILWLYIEDNQLTDAHLEIINTFNNLEKLVVNRNQITDKGLKLLENHSNLLSLNIYNNNITDNCLESLMHMHKLQKVYAWQTAITEESLNKYQQEANFPEVILASY